MYAILYLYTLFILKLELAAEKAHCCADLISCAFAQMALHEIKKIDISDTICFGLLMPTICLIKGTPYLLVSY